MTTSSCRKTLSTKTKMKPPGCRGDLVRDRIRKGESNTNQKENMAGGWGKKAKLPGNSVDEGS